MKLHLPVAALRAAGLHPPVVQVGSGSILFPVGAEGGPGGRGAVSAISVCPPPQGAWESLAVSPWSPLLRLYSLGYIFCVFLKQGGREGE